MSKMGGGSRALENVAVVGDNSPPPQYCQGLPKL